ncbi:ABC transporter ATP-binding protein [Sphingomonas sp. 28-63-12]|uniref:ABC transporter ATP-binding protein n=1 Tax=Sphingomonas sp. 28-63-12 TaxID=1970434 RepID=UPI000BD227E3|nr:MAG: ABC transporter ATP-binding protein [Sphingomonas sp. 28-63-12]
MAGEAATSVRLRDVIRWAGPILGPDRAFFTLAIIYGIGISLLSLATPISVQMLINSVANTALAAPLFTLSGILFALLMLSALLSAFRAHLMEVFRQRIFAQLVAEITLRAIHSRNPFFSDDRKGDLFNRYFEVMNLQKAVPSLMIGLFTILLQSAVGFVVTSFYHPFFLGFNLLFILLAWGIWRLWSRGAMTSAVALSHAKYEAAHWLESVGASNGFYKSGRHISYAINKSEALTARYIAAYRRHFNYSFSQTVAYLVLYAVASAGLLALGGWLVIQGQLSIGQLVAAELILSSIFYGVAQLGPYLDVFYDLVTAVEEMGLLFDIPQEAPGRVTGPGEAQGDLAFAGVQIGDVAIECTIPYRARLIAAADPDTQRAFALLLKRHRPPDKGFITLGGADISALDAYRLRSDVIVLDRPTIVECSIRDYLELCSPDDEPRAMMTALRLVGIDRRLGMLPQGLDTVLASTGWPLSLPEMMRLKLAGALLSQPKILVMSPLFDMVPADELHRLFDALGTLPTTVIYFTNRNNPPALDGYLWLGRDRQWIEPDRATFNALRRADPREAADADAR